MRYESRKSPSRASAEGGGRTHTPLSGHRILSPARLPIPPLRRAAIVAPGWGSLRSAHEAGHPHRRRRLPRPERRDPRRQPPGDDAGRRGRRGPRRLARAGRRRASAARAARDLRSSRAAARSSAPRGRTRSRSRAASSGCSRTEQGLDALVAVGGEDTLGVAARLHAEHGPPVVGVPKTIDNDLSATDYTFGFDTAVRSRPRRSTACTRPPSRTTA